MPTAQSVTRIIRGLLWALAAIGAAVYLYTFWNQPALISVSGDWVVAETTLEIWLLRGLYVSLITFAIYREICRLSPNPRLSYNPLIIFLVFCVLILAAYAVLIY